MSLATYQLTGRGRGSNTWLSPLGCLQFSLVLRVPLSSFPPSRLVFVQYLFGMAVVSAVKDASVLGADRGAPVKLKWPNDVYIDMGRPEMRMKIGGILVNTSFSGGMIHIVVGTSASRLLPQRIAFDTCIGIQAVV